MSAESTGEVDGKILANTSNDLPKTSEKVAREGFPDPPMSPASGPPATLENFAYLLEHYDIRVRFNRLKKRADVDVPGLKISQQNRDEVVLSHLTSLALRNGMSQSAVKNYLLAVADRSEYDPFADWVSSKPWDGKSRLEAICATVEPRSGYSPDFRSTLIQKWLLSIAAATFKKSDFKARGVLTLQGGQGVGKTSWFANLVGDEALRRECVKLGHSWDGGSKDARLGALKHRIVELGELEGSFRKEMASLKAFITESQDKIRPPYGRVEAEYPRSTIFGASVNDRQFLLDTTGNSRFWTIAANRIDFNHQVDTQQLFAEMKVRFEEGDQWWLTAHEERLLSFVNQEHRLLSVIEAQIREALDLSKRNQENLPRLSAREVLERLGNSKPTNAQFKEANAALRTLLGEPKKVRGYHLWYIPWNDDAPGSLGKAGRVYPDETY